MATVSVTAVFKCDVEKVWSTVTSFEEYSWRSDLSKIEVLGETQFIEHTKDGYATKFTVTEKEPFKLWEFDMETNNIKGHWVGLFSESCGETTINFTECVTAKKFFMKPFIKVYLKRQQALYMFFLEKALSGKKETNFYKASVENAADYESSDG